MVGSIDLSETRERNDIPYAIRLIIFLSFLYATFFVNLDTAIFAPALLKITQDLNLQAQQVAMLNGALYTVCGFVTIFSSSIMLRFDAKHALIFAAICNSLATFMFISVSEFYVIVAARAISGLSQAIICTY